MKTRFYPLLGLSSLLCLAATVSAAPAKNRIQETVTPSGALVRSGSGTKSTVSADGKSVSLQSGVMLASSKSGGLMRSSVTVETPQVTMKTQGTALVAYQPEKFLKITCIEGTVTVRLRALLGEFVKLGPGQMLIINPAEANLPEAVEIDLNKLVETSALTADLPVADRIDKAARTQVADLAAGRTAETPIELQGAGPEVIIVPEQSAEVQREVAEVPAPPTVPAPAPKPKTGGGTGGSIITPVGEVIPLFLLRTSSIFADTNVTTPGSGQIPAEIIPAKLDLPAGPWVATAPGNMQAIEQPNMSGFYPDGVFNFELGAMGEFRINGVITGPGEGNLLLFGHPLLIEGSQGSPAGVNQTGGTLELLAPSIGIRTANVQAAGDLLVSSPGPVDVNNARLSGGDVRIGEASARAASISITNSSQLVAMSNVYMNAQGGIGVGNSSMQATNDMNLDSGGPMQLINATMSASSIIARTHNGAELFISNSTLNASQLIQLYAGDGGNLRFAGNVNLDAGTNGNIRLAGAQVIVENGGNVNTAYSPVGVWSDNHQYNIPGRGNINGSITTGAYNARPNP